MAWRGILRPVPGDVAPIKWHPFREFGSHATPFDRTTSASSLRVTFDDESLGGATGPDADAVELLRGFAAAGLVDGVGLQPSELPHLVVSRDGRQLRIKRSEGEQWPLEVEVPEEASFSLSTPYGGDPQRPEVVALAESYVRVLPHHALRRDILISLDRGLLRHRAHSYLADLNVRSPAEGAQILGLFLRSCSNYTYRAWGGATATTDRHSFFQELAEMKMGMYWRLHFATEPKDSDRRRSEAHVRLSWSVVSRIAQALEALDELGAIYYGSGEGHDASQRALYHFNYGLLLLSGALDAFLRLIQPVIGGTVRPSLTSKSYMATLQEVGAEDLLEAIRRPTTQATAFLLGELRNLIHEMQLQTHPAADGSPGVQVPYASIGEPKKIMAIRVWCAARQMTEFADFGLTVRRWDRLMRGGVEDTESERFEITLSLYPYLRSLTHAVAVLLGELGDCAASFAQERGHLIAATVDPWSLAEDRTRRRQAIRLLG